MIFRNLVVVAIAFMVNISAGAQQNPSDSLLALWEAKGVAYPREVLYIQTSKDVYQTGEDLWFKVYQMDAHSFGLSDLSRTLFLQMVATETGDSVVWQEKYLIDSGFVAGHIYVDEKLRDGHYTLKAYTSHSTFSDPRSLVASCTVKIVDNINKPSKSDIAQTQSDSIRFDILPEGGSLVVGLVSTVAFKATDSRGRPVDFRGAIYRNDQPIVEIHSRHDGMGSAQIRVESGANYYVKLNNGVEYPLPEAEPSGMVLHLAKRDENYLYFSIAQSANQSEQTIMLRSQMRGVVYCLAQSVIKDSLRIRVPLAEFDYQGIAEFTLLDGLSRPMAERLVYVNGAKGLKIAINPEKTRLATREKATVKITVTDNEGKPVSGVNLGLSVYDQAFSVPNERVDIVTYCFLRSQIRGTIHNPAYYFNSSNNDREQALDLLLLTQGWRRYVWNLDSAEVTPSESIFLTDHILCRQDAQMPKEKGKRTTNPSAGQLIRVSGPNGNSMLVWTDSVGGFSIATDMMRQLRGGYIYLSPLLDKKFRPKLSVEDPFVAINALHFDNRDFRSTFITTPQTAHSKVFVPAGLSLDSVVNLDDVVVTAKGARVFRDKFMGRLDSLAQLELGPWVCAHGYLENWKDGYTHHHNPEYCPCPSDPGAKSKPVIGRTYSVLKPEYYECNKRGGWCFIPKDSGHRVYEGIPYTEEELLARNNLWRTKGYYPAREFYRADQIDMEISTPDNRNTLLWAPCVMTDSQGEATVSFYCSDINTTFVIVADATDGEGLLGSSRSEFRVMKGIAK